MKKIQQLLTENGINSKYNKSDIVGEYILLNVDNVEIEISGNDSVYFLVAQKGSTQNSLEFHSDKNLLKAIQEKNF